MKSITCFLALFTFSLLIISCTDSYEAEQEECGRLNFEGLPEVDFLADYYSQMIVEVGPIDLDNCSCQQLQAEQEYRINNLGEYIPQYMPMPLECEALIANCNSNEEEALFVAQKALNKFHKFKVISTEEKSIMNVFFEDYLENFQNVDFDNYRCLIKDADKSGISHPNQGGFLSTLFIDLAEGEMKAFALLSNNDQSQPRWIKDAAKWFAKQVLWEGLKAGAKKVSTIFTADPSCDSCYAEEVFDALLD